MKDFNLMKYMIIVIIKTVIFTLCVLAVLLMFFAGRYDFCIWKKKCKIPKVYFSDSIYVYDRFNYLVNTDDVKCRSRIEIDFENNTIRIETKGSSEISTYTFSKYKVIDEEGSYIEFMFKDGYEIEYASLELGTQHNEPVFKELEIRTKNCDNTIQYF